MKWEDIIKRKERRRKLKIERKKKIIKKIDVMLEKMDVDIGIKDSIGGKKWREKKNG